MKGKRKKLPVFFLYLLLIAALTACAGRNEGAAYLGEPAMQSEADAESSDSETLKTDNRQELSLSDTNILIAYFTWAENTHVENPEVVDMDATTSASVLLPGNTVCPIDQSRRLY